MMMAAGGHEPGDLILLAAAEWPTQGRAGGALVGKGPSEIGLLCPLGRA